MNGPLHHRLIERDLALDHDLSRRGHAELHGLGSDDLDRLPQQGPEEMTLVGALG